METNYDLPQAMEKLRKESKRRTFFSGFQCLFNLIAAACIVSLLVTALQFIPQVEALMQRADLILEDLEDTTDRLEKLELEELVQDVDTLVATGQTGVEDAMDKINSIDTDRLNRAISDFDSVVKDLSQIIGPLKKVAGLFK